MDRYQVELMSKAFNDLDGIYSYIVEEIKDISAPISELVGNIAMSAVRAANSK